MGPKSTNNLCETFVYLSAQTATKLAHSIRRGLAYGEQTITDTNLLEIQIAHPSEVCVHKFNSRTERKSGADWEWWFVDGPSNRGIGLRVQAKKMDKQRNYSAFKESQCQALLHDAATYSPECFPFYCFYNWWWPESEIGPECHCGQRAGSAAFGCSVLPAQIVLDDSGPKCDRSARLLRASKPWQCLVCCKDAPKMGSIAANVGGTISSFGFEAPGLSNIPLSLRRTLGYHPPDFVVEWYESTDPVRAEVMLYAKKRNLRGVAVFSVNSQ